MLDGLANAGRPLAAMNNPDPARRAGKTPVHGAVGLRKLIHGKTIHPTMSQNPDPSAELARLREQINSLTAKATPGPWHTETEHHEGEFGSGPDTMLGYRSYFVEDHYGRRICDSMNTEHSVEVEWGNEEDCGSAWDETGKRNLELIAFARTGLSELLRIASLLESQRDEAQRKVEELEAAFKSQTIMCENALKERDAARGEFEKGRQWNQLLEMELKNLRSIHDEENEDRPLQTEVIYRVYARHKGSTEWVPQESSYNKDDVIGWAQRNTKRNAETFVEGAGREYIAVSATTTFELIIDTDAIFSTMREVVLEAPAGEVDALAQEAGSDVKEMSEMGRNTINKAIALSKQNSAKDDNI